jgi:hypothetical protein
LTFSPNLSYSIILHLQVYDPTKRLTIQQCLEHEYFAAFYEKYPPETCTEIVDWSFDSIELDKEVLRNTIYEEVISFRAENERLQQKQPL